MGESFHGATNGAPLQLFVVDLDPKRRLARLRVRRIPTIFLLLF